MTIWTFLGKYGWYIALLIFTYYVFYKLGQNRKIKDFKLKEMAFMAEFLLSICILIFFQNYIFNDNWYFTIAFVPFFMVFYSFILWLFKDRYKYVIVSTILGEEFFNPIDNETVIVPTTQTEIIIIPTEVFKELEHIGNKDRSFWEIGDTIKHADYFDEENRLLYHPEIPELHNFRLIDAMPYHLVMKEDIPKLRRENIMYRHYLDYLVAFKQEVIEDKFVLKLRGLYNQHKDEPFPVRDNIQDIQKAVADRHKAKDEEPKTIEEVNTDADRQNTSE